MTSVIHANKCHSIVYFLKYLRLDFQTEITGNRIIFLNLKLTKLSGNILKLSLHLFYTSLELFATK